MICVRRIKGALTKQVRVGMALVGGLEGAKSMGAGATTTMSERLLSYRRGPPFAF